MSLTILILPFFFLKKRKYILIGGHEGKLYADNSKVFYEYLINIKKDPNVYWVINKDSKHKEKLNKNYCYRGSVKNYIYFYLSKVNIYSHTCSDIVPIAHKFFRKALRINLGHGMDALKKVYIPEGYRQNNENTVFIAVSEFEKKIKKNFFKAEKVEVLGLPRFDLLIKNVKCENIIYMPTWREWLSELSDNELEKTEYFKNVTKFLTSKKLEEILLKNNIKLKVYLHFYMHKFYKKFSEERRIISNVILLPTDTDVQKELIENKLLITDYSSVTWDFIYQNKNVLFFMFDQNEYEKKRGSFINLNTELPGKKFKNFDILIEKIEDYYKNTDIDNEEYIKKYFKYNDSKNCERLYNFLNRSK